MLAVQGQRQRRACNKFERFRGYPYHWLPPHQAPPRCPQRTLCKHHVQSSSVELLDQRRTHTDLDLKLHIRMSACKPTECRRQRTTSNFFDCSKAHGAGKWRRCKAAASRFFQLQQAARVTQEHLAVIGQGHRSGGATKKRSLGLELKTFDLLAHGRLREVQPLRRAVEAPAFSDGNKRTQQLEFH